MNTLDKITRDTLILVDSVRDSVSNNLMKACLSAMVDLDEKQLSDILKIVDVSCNEGYQKSISVFQNTIKKHLDT